MGLECNRDIAHRNEVVEAFGDATLIEKYVEWRLRRYRLRCIEVAAQGAPKLRRAMPKSEESLNRTEWINRDVEQTWLDGSHGDAATRRRHPVIDLDLHVVERDELDVLDFALRQDGGRIATARTATPDAPIECALEAIDGRLTIDATPSQCIKWRIAEQIRRRAFDFDLLIEDLCKVTAIEKARLATRANPDADALIGVDIEKRKSKRRLAMRTNERYVVGFRLHLQPRTIDP